MCPVYKATAREQASPRAKANLLRAAVSGVLDPEGVGEKRAAKAVLDFCIGCGMCAVECPSGVNIPKLVLEARSRYRLASRPALTDTVLSRAETLGHVGAALAPLVNPLVGLGPVRLGAQLLMGLDRRRPLGRFAHPPFHRIVAGRINPVPFRGTDRTDPLDHPPDLERTVAYFYDLFADYYDPGLAETVLRVLDAHDCRVVLPRQRSSGIPEMFNGYARRAQRVAGVNIQGAWEHVQRGATLVSAEPTASFAFRVHYPDYANTTACSLVAPTQSLRPRRAQST
jgi:Fe-S oxidoreductase